VIGLVIEIEDAMDDDIWMLFFGSALMIAGFFIYILLTLHRKEKD
jgi:hypothetical protein